MNLEIIHSSEIKDGSVTNVNKGPSELLEIAVGIWNDDNAEGCLNEVTFKSA